MEDPVLNRKVEETRELHTRWSQFHDFMMMAQKGGKITGEAEKAFLDLKKRICMLHDGFMQSLKHDQNIGQQVLSIVGNCIMLKRIPMMNSAEIQKLELDWNASYLLMTETIANLEEDREKLANINEKAYRIMKAKEAAQAAFHRVAGSLMFKLTFFCVVIPVFLLAGVPAMNIYDWWELKYTFPRLAPMMIRIEEKWRRYVNPELKYLRLNEIPVTPDILSAPYKREPSAAIPLSQLTSNLLNLGFAKPGSANILVAQDLVRASKDYRCEGRRMANGGKWGMSYKLLFDTPKTARKFCDLRREGMATYEKGLQDQIDSVINVCRRSNFVVIYASEEEILRVKLAKDQYAFDEAQMHQ